MMTKQSKLAIKYSPLCVTRGNGYLERKAQLEKVIFIVWVGGYTYLANNK